MFLEILQNSLETPVPESLFYKVAGLNFIKKETLAQVFSCEFYEISKNIFFYRSPLVVASDFYEILTKFQTKEERVSFLKRKKLGFKKNLILEGYAYP